MLCYERLNITNGGEGGGRCDVNTAEMVSEDGAVGKDGLDYRRVVIRSQAARKYF